MKRICFIYTYWVAFIEWTKFRIHDYNDVRNHVY